MATVSALARSEAANAAASATSYGKGIRSDTVPAVESHPPPRCVLRRLRVTAGLRLMRYTCFG
jgi:hypothetical protein